MYHPRAVHRSRKKVHPGGNVDSICCLCKSKDCRIFSGGQLASEKQAEVAELADARGSGPRTRKGVGVRVPSSAPIITGKLSYFSISLGDDKA
jgi:hypothetical protein